MEDVEFSTEGNMASLSAALKIFYIIQSKMPSFSCMLMFNTSPRLSVGTIIRYPQREIEKLIVLSILYFSDPLETVLRAAACCPGNAAIS